MQDWDDGHTLLLRPEGVYPVEVRQRGLTAEAGEACEEKKVGFELESDL